MALGLWKNKNWVNTHQGRLHHRHARVRAQRVDDARHLGPVERDVAAQGVAHRGVQVIGVDVLHVGNLRVT